MGTKKHNDQQGYIEYATVSDAAAILGVSIDTVRRWEKAGKLHAKRLDGKNRYFAIPELELFKENMPLSTSQVAAMLNVSASTVRRLEDQGYLKPDRSETGKRLYDHASVSAYVADKKSISRTTQNMPVTEVSAVAFAEVQETPTAVAEPQRNHSPRPQAPKQPSRKALASKVHNSGFKFMQRIIVYGVGIALLLVSVFSILLLITPGTMTNIFYGKDKNGNPQSKGVAARLFQPFANRALNVVGVVNPELKDKVQPVTTTNVTQIFTKDSDGNITSTAGFSPPSSSFLKIPDSNLVVNLNSQYVQGQKPGESAGDLALLPIQSVHIKDGTIQSEDIAEGAIQISNLGQDVIALLNSIEPAAPAFNGINGIQAGAGLMGGGSSGTPTLSVQTGLSTQIISGGVEVRLGTLANATISSVSGLEVTSAGLGLIGGCSANQVLKWDGSEWKCANDIAGGGSFDVQEGGSTVTSPVAAINFNANDFTVTDNVGQANIVIDYANSGIARRNQNETIAGTWTFTNGTSFGGAVSATSFSGNGSALTNVNAAQLNGQTSAYYLNAGNLTGSLSDARLSSNVTLAGNTFNGSNQLVQLNGSGALPALNGVLLTNINAASLGGQTGTYYLDLANATGTLPIARIADASLTNAKLQNSGFGVSLGANLSGSASVALGGTLTVNMSANPTFTSVTATTFTGNLTGNISGNAATATALAANPADCTASQFATAIAANGNLSCAALTNADVPDDLTISASGSVADGALSANVTLAGNIFNGNSQLVQTTAGGLLPALDGSLVTNVNATTLAGQNGLYYLDLANATGTLATARIADGSIANVKLANSSLTVTAGNGLVNGGAVSLGGSVSLNIGAGNGIAVNADDIAVNVQANKGLEVDGNGLSLIDCGLNQILKYNGSGQWACGNDTGGGSGGAIDGTGTDGRLAFFDGTGVVIADSVLLQGAGTLTLDSGQDFVIAGGDLDVTGAGTFSGAVTAASFSGNGAAVTNVNAAQLNGQAASYYLDLGNATGALSDARLSTNVTLAGNTFNGNSQLVQTTAGGLLPALNGSLVTNVNASQLAGQTSSYYLDLGNATGTLAIARIADGSIANVKLANSSFGTSFGTNLSGSASVALGGTLTVNLSATPTFTSVAATTFTGALTGNASTATALAANPTDCGANQFATAIAANGNLSCAALTDADVPDTLTIGSSSTVADGALSANVTLGGNSFNGVSQLVQTTAGGLLPGLNGSLVTNVNAAQLGGQGGSYYLDLANATGTLATARIADASITNAKLANNSVTVTAGTGLSGGGSVVLGASTSLSVAYGALAGTAVQGNTTLTCASGSGNLSGGGNSITLGSGGTCNNITTNNAVSFSTSVTTPTVTNAGNLTLSSTGIGNDIVITTADKLLLTGFNCSSFDNGGVLTVNANGEVVCDNDDGGAAGTITGSGSTGRLPLYTGAQSLGTSWLAQTGSTLQLDNTRNLQLLGGNVTVNGDVTATNLFGDGTNVSNVDAVSLSGQAGSYYLDLANATGTLAIARIADGSITNLKLANSSFATSFGTNLSGSGSVALGGTLSVNLTATPSFTSVSATTFTGALTGNASTASALAANPTDCAVNQFATAIDANGNLSCAMLTDADVPDTLTIGSSSTIADGALSSNVTLAGNTFNGNSQLVQTTAGGLLPALNGSLVTNVDAASLGGQNASYYLDLGNATGTLTIARIADSSITNLKLANSSINTNFGTNLSGSASVALGGTLTVNVSATPSFTSVSATTFTGTLTGNASTATALAADPSDCAANQFATAIAANGNLTCAAITDADVSDTLTASIFQGSGSTTNAVDLGTAEVAGTLTVNRGGTGLASYVIGDLIYASGTNTLSRLADVAVGSCLISGGVGAAPQWGSCAAGGGITGTGSTDTLPLFTSSGVLGDSWLSQSGSTLQLASGKDFSLISGNVTASTFIGSLNGNATTATALAANPTDCSSNQFANAIAANGNLTCASLTDADIPDTLTIGASSTVADGALSANVTKLGSTINLDTNEVTGNLRATNLQSAGADLGAANVTVDLSNTNGSFVTNLTTDGTITAGSFSGNGSGLSNVDASTLSGQSGSYYLDLANATGTLAIARIADGSITNTKLTNSSIGTSFGTNLSGSASVALGGTLSINLTATPTFTSVNATTFTGAFSGNASTATALAADPSDCAANTFATTIAANGNLTCASISKTALANSGVLSFAWSDSEVTDTLTIGASSTVADGALSANVTKLGSAIDLATNEVNGNLKASSLQSTATDLGAANVTVDLSNSNGSFVTNLTTDGTITAATFVGNLSGTVTGNLVGNAATASALAADPTDCSANQFATAIAASGNLSCAALTDADIPNNITISLAATATALAADPSDCAVNTFATSIAASGNLSCSSVGKTALANSGTLAFTWSDAEVADTLTASIFIGTGSTTNAIDLATAEVSGILPIANGGTGTNTLTDLITLGTHTTGNYVATLGALTGLSTTGNTGEGSAPTLAVLYGSTANTAVQGNVTLTCASGTGNLTGGGGGAQALGGGITCGNISTNNAVSFTTSVTTPLLQNAGLTVAATGANSLIFQTNGVTRLTITSTGASTFAGSLTVSSGGASISGGLNNNSGGITNAGAIAGATTITASGNINTTGVYQKGGVNGISVTCTGNDYLRAIVTSGGIMTGSGACAGIGLSDERVKTDITDLNDDTLDKLKDVRTVSFYFDCTNSIFTTTNIGCETGRQSGVIAQELATIFPELVYQDENGLYRVKYDQLSIYNLKATTQIAQYIEQNKADKTTLDLTIAGLDSRLATVEQKVADLENGLTQGGGQQIDLNDLQVGKLTVSLDLLVSGGLTVSGPSVFEQLVTFNSGVNVLGALTQNNSAGGYATINPGQQSVHISFSTAYSQAPLISVSLGQGKFAQYSYANVTSSGFDIVINGPASEQLQFSWTATSIHNPLTFVQP